MHPPDPMSYEFTAAHRGGTGTPMLCLHGFMGTWRAWEPVLAALERRHDVLAPTLPGHAGGPPLRTRTLEAVADAVEGLMDAAGFERAHLVGNSLGGYLALTLAARDRARSVVALAPAGGWAGGDGRRDTLEVFARSVEPLRVAAGMADALAATAPGRALAMRYLVEDGGDLPAELVSHLLVGAARCEGAAAMIEHAQGAAWELDAERVRCPVRVVWGTADRLLPWPAAAERYRREWLPGADWVELDGVGHCPQLERPLETAQLILGFTAQ